MAGKRENRMTFRPLTSKRVFEEISDQIKEGIHSGILRPGDKLPPERELARQFNAGRMAVREALRVLEDSGFIYIVKGTNGGSFVKAPDTSDVIKSVRSFALRGDTTLEQITEARLAVELSNLDFVVKKITQEQLQTLKQNLQNTEALLLDGAPHNYTIANFHVVLARASGNPLLETFIGTLISLTVDFLGKGKPEESFLARHLESHRNLYSAIAGKDMEAAKKILREHILDAHNAITTSIRRVESRNL